MDSQSLRTQLKLGPADFARLAPLLAAAQLANFSIKIVQMADRRLQSKSVPLEIHVAAPV